MTKSWGHFYSKKADLDFFIRNTACHRVFFELILKDHPKKVLEIGAGTGSMSIFLSHLGLDVTSLDNNDTVLKNAKELTKDLNGKVNFIKGEAFKMDFRDNQFDVIFHQGLLEHFSDDEIINLLREQLRVAKKIVFSVPNNLYGIQDYGNERLLSKEYWDKLLSQNLKLITSQNYNHQRKTLLKGLITYQASDTFYLAEVQKS